MFAFVSRNGSSWTSAKMLCHKDALPQKCFAAHEGIITIIPLGILENIAAINKVCSYDLLFAVHKTKTNGRKYLLVERLL